MKRLITGAEVLTGGELKKVDVLFDEHEILAIGENLPAAYANGAAATAEGPETETADAAEAETAGAPNGDGEIEIIHADGLTLLPGLVDVHVHLREPGFEQKETIATGTRAAAHGGFTTILPMPNLNPFPDSPEHVTPYLEKIKSDAVVHTLPYGTITQSEAGKEPTDFEALKAMGIKHFSDDGVGIATEEAAREAFTKAAAAGVLVACHTEDMSYRGPGSSVHDGEMAKRNGWVGIPSLTESAQLERDLKIAGEVGLKYHGCHISCRESLEALRAAKARGTDCSAEVTAHHLLLEEDDVKGPNWKMNPPLRTHEDRLALIEALEDGTLDFIASDHAPHTKADKDKPMAKAAFGIVSLETSFALLYSEFVHRTGRWSLAQLVSYMSEKPAERFGLSGRGKIEVGAHSDLVLARLGEETVIHAEDFYSKGKNTPFDGWTVYAKTVETIVDGKTVYKEEA